MIPILFLVLVFSLFFIIVSLYKYSFVSRKKVSRLPPSPPGLPIIGNLLQMGALPHRSLQVLAKRHGDVMMLKFGSVPTVVVSSAEAAKEVMKTRDHSFASRPKSIIADILFYGGLDMAYAQYGDYWRQVRKISVLHLLHANQVQSFSHVREDEVSYMVSKVRSAAAAGGRVNLSEHLITLIDNIFCRVALGRKYSDEEGGSKKYKELLVEFYILLGAFPLGDYIPWLKWVDKVSGLLKRTKRNALELNSFIEKVMDDHLHHVEKPSRGVKDFVDILLSLSLDQEGSLGKSLSRDSIKAIILDMFAGGTDTTFTTLEWLMAELFKNPVVLNKVQEEVRANVGKNKTRITEEDISKMIYLKAAIKESLRLHPPVPLLLPRETIESTTLYGYQVLAKTRVIINAWVIQRDPKYWDKPDEYIPDRFINNPLDFNGLNFQFIPFGAGRRGCPGISFGMSNIELAVANLLYHFNWEMPDGLKGEDMDMTEVVGLTVRKKSNLFLIAVPHVF